VKITEARIRQIIREEIGAQTYKHVVPAVKKLMMSAQRIVFSLEGRKDDATDEFRDNLEQLVHVAKLLRKIRAPEADNMARLVRHAGELEKLIGFWKTPAFLGKKQHLEKVKEIFEHMKKVASVIISSISAATPPPVAHVA